MSFNCKRLVVRIEMLDVLIIDDSVTMRKMLEAMFNDMGCNVVATAKDGLEGIEFYEQHTPDIVTMDINMPAMSGLEALKNIRDKHKDANIFMLTSRGDNQSVMDAIKYGAKGYILKPPKKEKVKEAIENTMPNIFNTSKKNKDDLDINNNESSIKDSLTGLYTVQYMHHTIEHLIQMHNRYNDMEIGLLIVNIANLEEIVSQKGEMDRDIVLTQVADQVLATVRPTDIAIRLTNNEFGIFIMGTSTKDISVVASKLKSNIESIEDVQDNILIGMAIHHQKEHLIAFIERADKAISQASSSKEDKIFMAE